jgi:hypothetical protein
MLCRHLSVESAPVETSGRREAAHGGEDRYARYTELKWSFHASPT